MPTALIEPAAKHLVVDPKKTIELLGLVELLHKHVTESLCSEVFLKTRDRERQRKWSLHSLMWFWVAVTIRAPKALSHALDESHQGGDRLLPHVDATSEAFFEKCQDLRSDFFAGLYEAVGPRMLPEAVEVYASGVADLRRHFPEIWVMDGSQLSEVARRLKILWKVHGAVLPGRLMVLYDLFRGISRVVRFEPDAAKNENLLAKEVLEIVPSGTLLLGDRLYGIASYFAKLSERKLWGVFRRHGVTKVKILERLSSRKEGQQFLEELLVDVGCGANGVAVQRLRLIRYQMGKKKLQVFTNVLDSEKLPAVKVIELYGMRWSIERMFFDLKEVLNLNRFYAANPNAIAMQVYAAVIVYNAFRIVQGRVAAQEGIAAEMISPARLFPRVAAASAKLATAESTFAETVEANPKVKLVKPDWSRQSYARTTLGEILVRPKYKPRTKGTPNPRSIWKSFRHVPGGARFLRKLS